MVSSQTEAFILVLLFMSFSGIMLSLYYILKALCNIIIIKRSVRKRYKKYNKSINSFDRKKEIVILTEEQKIKKRVIKMLIINTIVFINSTFCFTLTLLYSFGIIG